MRRLQGTEWKLTSESNETDSRRSSLSVESSELSSLRALDLLSTERLPELSDGNSSRGLSSRLSLGGDEKLLSDGEERERELEVSSDGNDLRGFGELGTKERELVSIGFGEEVGPRV